MTEHDDRSPDEQPPGSESREAEQAPIPEDLPEVPQGASDYIKGLVDARVAAFYRESWPTVLREVVAGLAERLEIDHETIAVKAADIAQARMEDTAEIIKRRLQRVAVGGGGSDGRASNGDGGGGGGGGGDDGLDDLRDLNDLPDEPGRVERSEPPRRGSSGGRREQMLDVVLTGLAHIFQDPGAFVNGSIDAYVKLKQARKPAPDDLALAEALYQRRPWLFDVFGKPDSLAEKIPTMGSAAYKAGLQVGSGALSQFLREFSKGKGNRAAARFNPWDDMPAPDGPPEPATAPAGQDRRPTRGRLRKVA